MNGMFYLRMMKFCGKLRTHDDSYVYCPDSRQDNILHVVNSLKNYAKDFVVLRYERSITQT